MIADLFCRCAENAAALIDSEAVAGAWETPSVLAGYDVSGLAGHLARAVLTVERYLDRPSPDPGAELTDAAGYFTRVLGSDDPVDSDLHRKVRQRGAETAAEGPSALAAEVRAAVDRLRGRLVEERMSDPVAALGDVALPLGEYLRTRLVELVVHLDDLAVSVGQHRPAPLPTEAYRTVAAVLGQVAVERFGGLETVRGLARRERHPDAIRAL